MGKCLNEKCNNEGKPLHCARADCGQSNQPAQLPAPVHHHFVPQQNVIVQQQPAPVFWGGGHLLNSILSLGMFDDTVVVSNGNTTIVYCDACGSAIAAHLIKTMIVAGILKRLCATCASRY